MNEATWQLEPVRDDPEKVYITSWDVTRTGGHKQVYLSNHLGSLSLHDKASLGASDGQWGLFDTHTPGRYVLVLDNIIYMIVDGILCWFLVSGRTRPSLCRDSSGNLVIMIIR